MFEALIAFGVVLLLGGLALLATIPLETAMEWGSWGIAAGFVLGVPTGFIYHVLLWQELRRVGPVPRGWIWNPFAHHHRISRLAEGRVMPWAIAGAVGFVLIVLGIALWIGGLANEWLSLR